MKRTLLFSITLLLIGTIASAQTLPCGGGRFSTRVFSGSTVTPNILYGRNTTFMGVVKNLYMDIFEPTGDVAAIRPLFIFAFGGAFVSGDRTQLAFLCDSLARKGYVAVAIDYRLYDNPAGIAGLIFNPNDGIDATAKAMSDIKAVIRYFKRDAATTKTYRIDPNNIYLGGISSGSIAALHTTYINSLSETVPPVSTIITTNGGMEGNTDLAESPTLGLYTFQGIKGVWNMSGALYDSGYIKAGDAPLYSIHGTADAVVPFGYGQLFGLGSFVCGSNTLNNQAIKVGVQTKFLPIAGGDHSAMYDDPLIRALIDSTAPRFFGNIICPAPLPVTGLVLKGAIGSKKVELHWQTLTETANKEFELEKLQGSTWLTIGTIRSKAPGGYSVLQLDYSLADVQPAYGANTYRLKMISTGGEITYSNTLTIIWNGKPANNFVIYPNPVTDALRYKTTVTGSAIVKIYSTDMRLLQTNALNSLQTIPVKSLAKGTYLAVVINDQYQRVSSSWFIKE
ncbi:MAG: T9SS type A sorting domain-containing protein [Chitinophagaceae bacterium]